MRLRAWLLVLVTLIAVGIIWLTSLPSVRMLIAHLPVWPQERWDPDAVQERVEKMLNENGDLKALVEEWKDGGPEKE